MVLIQEKNLKGCPSKKQNTIIIVEPTNQFEFSTNLFFSKLVPCYGTVRYG